MVLPIGHERGKCERLCGSPTGEIQGRGRRTKSDLLDEFVQVTGYHRKMGIRLLAGKARPKEKEKREEAAIWNGGAGSAEGDLGNTAAAMLTALTASYGRDGRGDGAAGQNGHAWGNHAAAATDESIDDRPVVTTISAAATPAWLQYDTAREPAETGDSDTDVFQIGMRRAPAFSKWTW